MKVQNTTIFMGDATRSERHNGISEEKNGRKSIFAGDMNKSFDPIARKRQQAKQQAMKIVGDAWANEKKLDEALADKRDRLKECRTLKQETENGLKEIDEEAKTLKETYGIRDEDQVKEDLELLDKRNASLEEGSDIKLTEEEMERLSQIDEAGLEEYRQKNEELERRRKVLNERLGEVDNEIFAIAAALADRKINRPQIQAKTIMKAQESADEIMEAASKEIIGMLQQEAKDHIDEEMEEKKEAAEEKAEKEEEEKEKIEKVKEEKKEKEEFVEKVADTTDFIVEADEVMKDVQKDIKKVMDEMKLLEEDLKGAAVDTTL